MEYYMDEKSKFSKGESSSMHSYGNSSKSSFMRSVSQKSSSSKSSLMRSFSTKNNSTTTTTSKSSFTRSSSQKCSNFSRKCGNLAKEQKAKFYIVKRCISMLVRWDKHRDS